MTVSVLSPGRADSDNAALMKALDIAMNVYGVKVQGDKAKELAKAQDNKLTAEQAKEQQARADQLAKDQTAFHSEWMSIPEGTPGSARLTIPGTQESGFFLPRKELSEQRKAALENKKMEFDVADKKGKEAKTTDTERMSAIYGKRLEQSDNILKNLEGDSGTNIQGLGAAVQRSSFFPEIAKSKEIKSYEQAQRNFISAVLRKESGASISPSEFENATKQYFPQAGDTPELIAQKQANRQLAIDGFRQISGNAWDQIKSPAPTAIVKSGGGKSGEAIAAPAVSKEEALKELKRRGLIK